MPILEAPAGFEDSTPERSISPAIGNLALNAEMQQQAHRLPIIHIHVQTPDPHTNNTTRNRSHSFDRDIAAIEEENQWPNAAVHLLPVTLPPPPPTEATLDELLQRVTERNDLQNVESIRLRVISYTISLSRLSLFLPRLQNLDLSGSVLGSLRDLGYGMLHLNQLNVSNCGLNSFDGISGFPALREVVADGNMIQRVGPLSELPLLQRLSAQNNRISELGLLSFLGLCPNLRELQLQGNPVCHLTLYRTTLQRVLPGLLVLDDLTFRALPSNQAQILPQFSNNNNVSTDADSDLSSLSSEWQTQLLSSSPSEAVTDLRPATAPTTLPNNVTVHRRANSERSRNRNATLSQGAVVVGSVLSIVRNARRRRLANAWISNNSSTDSPATSEAETQPAQVSNSSNCSSPDISSSN